MTQPKKSDSHSSTHAGFANYGVLYLTSLAGAGAWPRGARAAWVVTHRDEYETPYEVLARVLGVTTERVRQIYNQTKREAMMTQPDKSNIALGLPDAAILEVTVRELEGALEALARYGIKLDPGRALIEAETLAARIREAEAHE